MAERLAAAERYRWVALANTTAAMFMAALDKSFPSVNAGDEPQVRV